MSNATVPAMPLAPTAEVSEDADALVQMPFDPIAKLEETAHNKHLRLIAENTRLRLRLMALEEEIARLKGGV